MKTTNRAYKLYLAFIFALIAVLMHISYIGIQMQIQMSNGRKLADATILYSRHINSDKSILILGDSLAYGVGTSSPENSFAGQMGVIYPDHNIINKAVIGDATRQLADSILGKMDRQYDATFIFTGGNDIARYGIDLQASAANLVKIIEVAAENSNQVYVLTTTDFANVSIIPWFLAGFYSNRSDIIRRASQEIADRYGNVDYVDVFNLDADTYKTMEASDGFHLNDEGIRQLLNVVFDK